MKSWLPLHPVAANLELERIDLGVDEGDAVGEDFAVDVVVDEVVAEVEASLAGALLRLAALPTTPPTTAPTITRIIRMMIPIHTRRRRDLAFSGTASRPSLPMILFSGPPNALSLLVSPSFHLGSYWPGGTTSSPESGVGIRPPSHGGDLGGY